MSIIHRRSTSGRFALLCGLVLLASACQSTKPMPSTPPAKPAPAVPSAQVTPVPVSVTPPAAATVVKPVTTVEDPPPVPGQGIDQILAEMRVLEEAGSFHKAYTLGLEAAQSLRSDPRVSELELVLKRLQNAKKDLAGLRQAIGQLSQTSIREVRMALGDLMAGQEPAGILVRNAILQDELKGKAVVHGLTVLARIPFTRGTAALLSRYQRSEDPELRAAFQGLFRVGCRSGDEEMLKALVAVVRDDADLRFPEILAGFLAAPQEQIVKILGGEFLKVLSQRLTQAMTSLDPQLVNWRTKLVVPGLRGAADFLGLDATTKGDWRKNFGKHGAQVLGDRAELPSTVTIVAKGQQEHGWGTPDDPRALQRVDGSGRIASCWHGQEFTVDINLPDTAWQRLSIYCLDWDGYNGGRRQWVELLDPADDSLIGQQDLAEFQGGVYLSWQVSGPVRLRLRQINPSCLISGIFLDEIPVERGACDPSWKEFVRQIFKSTFKARTSRQALDLLTSPRPVDQIIARDLLVQAGGPVAGLIARAVLKGEIKGEGMVIACDILRLIGPGSEVAPFVDMRASLTEPAAKAACLSLIRVGLANGERGVIARILKSIEADPDLKDPDLMAALTCAPLAAVREAAGEAKMTMLQERLQKIYQDTRLASWRPVLRVGFQGYDRSRHGSWKGAYGRLGHWVVRHSLKMPESIRVSAGGQEGSWGDSMQDLRALQKVNGEDRIAGHLHSGNETCIKYQPSDDALRQITLYCLDWDRNRKQTVEVLDLLTGKLLDQRELTSFQGGVHLTWWVRGQVLLRLRCPETALFSAFFVDDLANDTGEQGWSELLLAGALVSTEPAEVRSALEAMGLALLGKEPAARQALLTRCIWGPLVERLLAAYQQATPEQAAARLEPLRFLLRHGQPEVVRQVLDLVLADRGQKFPELLAALTWTPAALVQQRVQGQILDLLTTLVKDDQRLAACCMNTQVAFDGFDRQTAGNWKGRYGQSGYQIAGDAAAIPASMRLGVSAQVPVWADKTQDLRALQRDKTPDRLVAAWHGNPVRLEVQPLDRTARRISLYCLDHDRNRTQVIEVLDSEGLVLDRREITEFQSGIYCSWMVRGRVIFRVSCPENVMVNGVFLEDLPAERDQWWQDQIDVVLLGAARPELVRKTLEVINDELRGKDAAGVKAVLERKGLGQRFRVLAEQSAKLDDPVRQALSQEVLRLGLVQGDQTSINQVLAMIPAADAALPPGVLAALAWAPAAQVRQDPVGAKLLARIQEQPLGLFADDKLVVALKTPDPKAIGKRDFPESDRMSEKFEDKGVGTTGWGTGNLPVIYVNPKAEPLNVGNGIIIPPRSVGLHPGSEHDVLIGWRSPVAGPVGVRAKVTHGHPNGGSDGVTWAIMHGTAVLAQGLVASGGSVQIPAAGKESEKLATIPVAIGDAISLVIGRNGGNPSDTTFVEFALTETAGAKRTWDLTKEVVDSMPAGNPHADSLGNAGVWHFLRPRDGTLQGLPGGTGPIPVTYRAATQVAFAGFDKVSLGNWKNGYGRNGRLVVSDIDALMPSVQLIRRTDNHDNSWADKTGDPRGLIKEKGEPGADRIASRWVANPMVFDLMPANRCARRITLYCLDWDGGGGRKQVLEVLDPGDDAVLDRREMTGFQQGWYCSWLVRGPVRFRLTCPQGAVLSGLFVDELPNDQDPAWVDMIAMGNLTTGRPVDILRGLAALKGELQGMDLPARQAALARMGYGQRGQDLVNQLFKATPESRLAAREALWLGLLAGEPATMRTVNARIEADKDLQQLDLLAGLLWAPGTSFQKAGLEAGKLQAPLNRIFASDDQRLATWRRTGFRTAFLGCDRRTQGTWKGVYGKSGAAVFGDGIKAPERTGITLLAGGQGVWAGSGQEARMVQKLSAEDRIAGHWASGGETVIDLPSSEPVPYRLTVYCLDWEGNRQQVIELLDPRDNAVIEARPVLDFHQGVHLSWAVRGSLRLRLRGPSPVVSAVFWDSLGETAADANRMLGLAGLNSSKADELQEAGRMLAFAGTEVAAPLHQLLTKGGLKAPSMAAGLQVLGLLGQPTGAAAYLEPAFQTPELREAARRQVRNGLIAGDADTIRGVWSRVAADTALQDLDQLAGLFLVPMPALKAGLPEDPAKLLKGIIDRLNASTDARLVSGRQALRRAVFLGTDPLIQGSWKGVYGRLAQVVCGEKDQVPAGITITPTGHGVGAWVPGTSELRAVQKIAGPDRIAGHWAGGDWQIAVRIADGGMVRLTLYCLDWDGNNGRTQSLEILDPVENSVVLDRREISKFSGGVALSWAVREGVTVRLRGPSAVLSGLFLDPMPIGADPTWKELAGKLQPAPKAKP